MLVVDDEPDAVQTLTAVLRAEGHCARGFSSAKEALAALAEFRPEVAILDVSMPEMSGWDLAKEIRQALGRERPLLVALTGQYTRDGDKALAREAGFDHYFYKPCDPSVLLTLLSRRRRPPSARPPGFCVRSRAGVESRGVGGSQRGKTA